MLWLGRGGLVAVYVWPSQVFKVQTFCDHQQLRARAILATICSSKVTAHTCFAAHHLKGHKDMPWSNMRLLTGCAPKLALAPSCLLAMLSMQGVSWHQLLTQRLSNDVKLVGPVISCGETLYQGIFRKNPHVQSYIMAMDREAIRIFMDEGHVLQCHQNRSEAIYYGELGSSLAILHAGYNIDSFQSR